MSEGVGNIQKKIEKSVETINGYKRSVEQYFKVYQEKSQIFKERQIKVKFIHNIVCLEKNIRDLDHSKQKLDLKYYSKYQNKEN